jgi:UDP-2-acetamido-2,6-beta-L-arabino-hexul-4-ose reductase
MPESPSIRILVTGSKGFIGKNLILRLSETSQYEYLEFTRDDDPQSLYSLVKNVDAVIHLAGENRPNDSQAFETVNVDLTKILCEAVKIEMEASGRKISIIFASSSQAELDNPYGLSKLKAENIIKELSDSMSCPAVIFRLPGVFGKWCKPNYNSVVATFCHNIANDIAIQIDSPEKIIKLAYIDDVLDAILKSLQNPIGINLYTELNNQHEISLGELAQYIKKFMNFKETLLIEQVGIGLPRALYSTFMSYLPNNAFVYDIPEHTDSRGTFVEMLKTQNSGQFSYFTAKRGITRGAHYHHTKTEKFLVIRGQAKFKFKHMVSNEVIEILTSGSKPQIVDTIPGWAHDITNIGSDELIVMLWANEIFDPESTDTINNEV